MIFEWKSGNKLQLLENGEEFFPCVFDSIRNSNSEIIIETFILFEDKVGIELHDCLIEAAQRNVRVMLTVDGYGTHNLSAEFVSTLTDAGVLFQVFDPRKKLLGLRTNLFRRLHRKIVVIDGIRAFIGGINYSAEHLRSYGSCSKQDYAVEIVGPVVEDIHRFALSAFINYGHPQPWDRGERKKHLIQMAKGGEAQAIFVVRDNDRHQRDIEKHYILALRRARRRIIIANAYFFPGYRLFRELCNAAKRGVDVHLILQGESDIPLARAAAKFLYDHLLKAGVTLYECCERPMHGKIALSDDEWATIGSSNLDPLSLSFNLEANIIVKDREFNEKALIKMLALIKNCCKKVEHKTTPPRTTWRLFVSFFVFHFLRHFPSWAVMLPRRKQKIDVYAPRNNIERT